MSLYLHLHDTEIPPFDLARDVWNKILADENYHIIVAEENCILVSSCTCVIVPNLTHFVRPYARVENVVTHPEYRGKGLATACLNFAKEIAIRENCYNIALLTGSKKKAH